MGGRYDCRNKKMHKRKSSTNLLTATQLSTKSGKSSSDSYVLFHCLNSLSLPNNLSELPFPLRGLTKMGKINGKMSAKEGNSQDR